MCEQKQMKDEIRWRIKSTGGGGSRLQAPRPRTKDRIQDAEQSSTQEASLPCIVNINLKASDDRGNRTCSEEVGERAC